MTNKATNWRHYETRQSGECVVFDDAGEKRVSYDMGIVETGRSRVFAGYFFRINLADNEQITAEDGGDMLPALWRLARNISARGLRLHCVGLSGQWRESGLSENTGWGYYGPHKQPMHMMDDMPADGDDEALERAIRDAVDGMRIGLA